MKKKIVIIVFLILFGIGIFVGIKVKENITEKRLEAERREQLEREKQRQLEIKQKIEDIESHYNSFVKTNEESVLYIKNDNQYQEKGKINKDIELELEEIEIDEHTDYFKIKNLEYYIPYENVEKIESINKSDRYKRYIPFNQNVVTKENITFYREDDTYAFELEESFDLPIIVKDNDKYYVEYNDQLYYVKKDAVTVKDNKNTSEKTRDNIRTFTYHAVYKKGETCKNSAICLPYDEFDKHMKYLSENNYLTLTMEELEMFLDKKINIPTKTVVITLDDGNLAKNAIEILEKYKLYATYFIITGRYDAYKIETTYVNFESHTDNLHNNYKCPGGEQGGQLLCEDRDVVLADLALSQEKLGGSKYIAYPFFDWNTRAFTLLKESGFHLAFVGQYDSEGYSNYNTNRFMIRRKTIFGTDSFETFKSYLK